MYGGQPQTCEPNYRNFIVAEHNRLIGVLDKPQTTTLLEVLHCK